MKIGIIRMVIWAVALLVCAPAAAWAEQKMFSGSGDGTSWHDASNWFTAGIPTTIDAVTINKLDLSVLTANDFVAQMAIIGGKTVSSWTVDNFVYGTISPPTSSDPAIYIRKDGTVTLKGSGVIVMKGSLKNTEEAIPSEPSVAVVLE